MLNVLVIVAGCAVLWILLLIRIDYRIRDNNSMKNLVYPFFITEAA